MKFKVRDLQYMVWGESGPFLKIDEILTDANRWDHLYDVIFRDTDTGKHYCFEYSTGATEGQNYDIFDDFNEHHNIECHEVELREVTLRKWVKINE